MKSRTKPIAVAPDLDLIGGTTALNFINTLRAGEDAPLETLRSDRDVRKWMKKFGITEPTHSNPLPNGSLLEAAHTLRAIALTAVQARKESRRVDLSLLNRFLAQAQSHLQLTRDGDFLSVRRRYSAETAEQILAPVAEAIADFLTAADFGRVHQCEGANCVLWFADSSKSGRRRFCTEEGCGTRTRVAAFRARAAKS